MAKEKKPAKFQIECRNDVEWRALCEKEGLIVVNVYPGWAGPCVSINNLLKKIKQDTDSSKLFFATACADKIDDLSAFRDQSEPIWLFLGSGHPVKLMRGAHVLHLANAIREELDHELQCIEGKARRNVISIEDDATRKRKLELELEAEEAEAEAELAAEEGASHHKKDSHAQLDGATSENVMEQLLTS